MPALYLRLRARSVEAAALALIAAVAAACGA